MEPRHELYMLVNRRDRNTRRKALEQNGGDGCNNCNIIDLEKKKKNKLLSELFK